MKKWKLTCSYMGAWLEQRVGDLDVHDRWTLVEMGEDVGKCAGREFEDADGPKDVSDSPLTWKGGQATETGCGPWWGGVGRNTVAPTDATVAECDQLLRRAGLPTLTVVMTSGVPDMDATFDVEGVNHEQLDSLDRAEWTLTALPDGAP